MYHDRDELSTSPVLEAMEIAKYNDEHGFCMCRHQNSFALC